MGGKHMQQTEMMQPKENDSFQSPCFLPSLCTQNKTDNILCYRNTPSQINNVTNVAAVATLACLQYTLARGVALVNDLRV